MLLRKCARDGAQIAGSRPIAAGTLVFASHGSAMKDVPEPDAFILDRPREHYLHYGWNRHTCLGQYVSPVIIVESMVAAAGPAGSRGGRSRSAGEPSFPLERRFGRLQLDDQNLYATTFSLQFADAGTTRAVLAGGIRATDSEVSACRSTARPLACRHRSRSLALVRVRPRPRQRSTRRYRGCRRRQRRAWSRR